MATGYVVKKFEDMFSGIRFDRIHERDRQTHAHRRTPHDGTGRACIASRGKNEMIVTKCFFQIIQLNVIYPELAGRLRHPHSAR